MPYIVQILTAAVMMLTHSPLLPQHNNDTKRREDTTQVSRVNELFRSVVDRLVRDGWDRSFVENAFSDERVEYIPKVVATNIRKPRGGSNSGNSAYNWMYADESVEACKTFIDKYSSILAAAEQKYGVDRQTLAALLRCETRHGSVTGTHHIFSVFASLARMQDRQWVDSSISSTRQALAEQKADSATVREEIEWIRNRAAKRGGWGYSELVNLLRIEQSRRCDALGLRGSWAGAFGWSQFLPSSYLRSAVDGNGDGRVDLFDPADAINSTANYLHKAGYRMGSNGARRTALRSYNNSTAYVESIVTLGDRVANTQKVSTAPSGTTPSGSPGR